MLEKYWGDYLRAWVREMLGNHSTLESWMRAELTDYQIQCTRIAWIDWMIKELENEDAPLAGINPSA